MRSSSHRGPQLISPVVRLSFPGPHVVLLSGLTIFVIVLALNLVSDAPRHLLDPRACSR